MTYLKQIMAYCQFRLNPVIVHTQKNPILSRGYNLNFDLSVSVASCHRENKCWKTKSKAKVHTALS